MLIFGKVTAFRFSSVLGSAFGLRSLEVGLDAERGLEALRCGKQFLSRFMNEEVHRL